MQRTLYYSPGTCSLGSMVVLEWLAEPYQLCLVKREQRRSEAYLKINPFGTVPAMMIDDRPLVESAAILLHLAKRAESEPLQLPDLGSSDWDSLQQWLSYLGSGFHAAFYPYFGPQKYIGREELHSEVKDAAMKRVRTQLEYVNRELSSKRFLLGERRSILDPYLYAMSRWANKFVDMPKEYPEVARHQAEELKDLAMLFALGIERGEAVKSPSGAMQEHTEFSET